MVGESEEKEGTQGDNHRYSPILLICTNIFKIKYVQKNGKQFNKQC